MEAIRREGLRLIYEHGYETMNLRQLAAAVGIQQGSLYNHIRTKQDLLFILIKDHMEKLLRELDTALEGEAEPAQMLRNFVSFHVGYHVLRTQEVFISYSELRSLTRKNYKNIVA